MFKNITKCYLFIIIQIFSTYFAINLFYFCTTWKHKQTMEQQTHGASDRTKSKQKQNQVTSHSYWPRVLLFDLAHKQCNGTIKGWFYCLRSESKGRFLVSNILMFWLSMMSGHGANPIFINTKIKIRRPEYSLNPHPAPTSDSISFLHYLPHPFSKWASYMYHPLYRCCYRRRSGLSWFFFFLQCYWFCI